jgi:hypothetical protein
VIQTWLFLATEAISPFLAYRQFTKLGVLDFLRRNASTSGFVAVGPGAVIPQTRTSRKAIVWVLVGIW